MRNMGREDLFERWLDGRRAASREHHLNNPSSDWFEYETFARFCERIEAVSDTVTGEAEVLPASEKRDVDPHG